MSEGRSSCNERHVNFDGLPTRCTIIEEDNQACAYASEIPHLTRGMKNLDLAV